MYKIIIGNLKAYMTYQDVKNYVDKITDNVILCPSAIYVPYFLNHNYKVGLQNISCYDNGAHTGEITAEQAKEIGISYVIVGHSERRYEQNETDSQINKKIVKALEKNINVILCIGEKKGENKEKIIKKQLLSALENVNDLSNVIIAYEPIWCIGTGITPTNNEIQTTIDFIQTILYEKCSQNAKIIYGGSVDKDNINILKNIDNLSGFLIGKASTDCEHLKKIIDSL